MKPLIGKWQVFFGVYRNNVGHMEMGWHVLDCGIVKITELPEEGAWLGKNDYKGIWIRFAFWIPFDRV